jgi:hypothetical protein
MMVPVLALVGRVVSPALEYEASRSLQDVAENVPCDVSEFRF